MTNIKDLKEKYNVSILEKKSLIKDIETIKNNTLPIKNKNKVIENKKLENYIEPYDFQEIPKKEFSKIIKIDNRQKFEITDKNLIARIESAIPNFVNTIYNTNAIVKGSRVLNEGNGIYQAIIKSGSTLDKSRELQGAFRATYRTANGGISGQANLSSVDDVLSNSVSANCLNVVMNIGSLIVGQYFMCHISREMNMFNDKINEIKVFQQSEFRARVETLCSQIQQISKYESEFLENEEQRRIKIKELGELARTADELLNQANNQINTLISKNNSKLKEYEKNIKSISDWRKYQNVLIQCLYFVDKLLYVFNVGNITTDACFHSFNEQNKKIDNVLFDVRKWHYSNIEKFKIDLNENLSERSRFDKMLHKPIMVLKKYKKSANYKKLPNMLSDLICEQLYINNKRSLINIDRLYEKDVRIIKDNNKYYYMPM